ncbi:MAG: pentapeptide repeat-containing protein [Oligoflexia bacterium]|nr:pentapeptide repeat-containing protein [Oligoflexia bacterium]
MTNLFKNKKLWVFGGSSVFLVGALSLGFFYYKAQFSGDFTERSPQSKFRIVYQAAQDIITKLRQAKLTELQGENLQGAYLRGFEYDNPSRVLRFDNADLRRADLTHSNLLRQVSFENANLEKAKLQNATWHFVIIRGANFKDAKMQGATINTLFNTRAGENIEELYNVSFKRAKMQETKINGEVNDFTDFREARLQGADLSAVQNLRDAKLTGAVYDNSTKLPFDDETAKRLGMIKI